MNTFSLSSWILQSITLFLAILASIPLLRAILGLSLVAISETFNLKNPVLRKTGMKLIPAFLRASLGLGIAIGFTTPASAETPTPQLPVVEIPVIDRVIDFETTSEQNSEQNSVPISKPEFDTKAIAKTETEPEPETVKEQPTSKADEAKDIAQTKTVAKAIQTKSYVIKSGDSLWSIAQNQLVGEEASASEIDNAWRKIWKANRDVIGNNPSLIRPGQEINLDVFAN
jgi:LysM repeat protein